MNLDYFPLYLITPEWAVILSLVKQLNCSKMPALKYLGKYMFVRL